MAADQYEERLAAIRRRFSAGLAARIEAVEAVLPELSENRGDAAGITAAHHRVHELCGLAPIAGFVKTGQAARLTEQILRPLLRRECPLTALEFARLRSSFQRLRDAAHAELSVSQKA